MPLTWILLLLVGALLGWLATVAIDSRQPREILGLVALGLLGAVFGALLITPILAGPVELSGFSLPALLLSLLGVFLFLALALLIRRVRAR